MQKVDFTHTAFERVWAPRPARSRLALVGRGLMTLAGRVVDGRLEAVDIVPDKAVLGSVDTGLGAGGVVTVVAEPGARRSAARFNRGAWYLSDKVVDH